MSGRVQAAIGALWPGAIGRGGAADWRAALARMIAYEADHGRFALWCAPAAGFGIIAFLSLQMDPPPILLYPAAAVALFAGVALRHEPRLAFAAMLVAGAAGGLVLGDAGTRRVFGPRILQSMPDAVVRGTVIRVEPRAERPPRVLLRVESIDGLEAEETPEKLSLTGAPLGDLRPGMAVEIRALVRPHPLPTHPGAYDPGFPGFFSRIGGTGSVRDAPTPITLPEPRGLFAMTLMIEKIRDRLTREIMRALGTTGPFAAALITGARSALPSDAVEEFAASGLSHMLVIAGLHMTLVAGGFYRLLRAAFALSPLLAERYPVKKWAAIGGLLAAAYYEVISGAGLSTSRAFVMIASGFIAILCDRPGISMRNLVNSALLLLVIDPSAILSVSFQMSYAATGIIVAAYERGWRPRFAHHGQPWTIRFLAHLAETLAGVAIIAALAAFAVAPYELHHFHHVAWFGVFGNLIATFVMELLVLPATILTLIVLPLGGGDWVLPVFGFTVDQLVAVARFVGTMPGASSRVAGFGALALAVSSFGLTWICLWRGPIASLGAVFYALGLIIGLHEPRADIYVTPGADTIAARGRDGRLVVDQLGRDVFTIKRWLEADADHRPPADPSLQRGKACDPAGCTLALSGGLLLAVPKTPDALQDDCRNADILVSRFGVPSDCPRPRLILDKKALAESQGMSLRLENGTITVTTVAASCGTRPWCGVNETRDPFGRPYAIRRPRETAPRTRNQSQ